ncbi:MAG: hypothetical protein ABIT37_25350 [Luteolibacter sp.]
MAALSSAPPSPSLPKPATFTPTIESLREPTMAVEIPVVIATSAPVPQAAPVEVVSDDAAAPADTALQHQSDPEFSALLDESDLRMKKKLFRQRMTVNLLVLGFIAGTGIWYSNSAKAQAEVKALVPAFRQSVKDFKMLGNLLGTFDKQLQKIGTHGTAIDDATKSMGIDPTKVSANDDVHMDKEMNEFTRGEGKTTHQRDQLLQGKFGIVAKLAGDKGKLGQPKPGTPPPAEP